jgi:hypothetical protein
MDVDARELKQLGIKAPVGMSAWQKVQLFGGGTLIFDDYGGLKYHIGSGVCSEAQTARLQSRWDNGEFGASASEDRRFVRMHRGRALRESRPQEAW